jgi:hypothetical protein
MKEIFNKARIQSAEIINQVFSFVEEKYQQANQVFSVGSAWGQIVSVVGQITNMVLYYVEDSITELNINTASRTASIQGLARLAGHNATRAISATGEITFKVIKAPIMQGDQIIIPNYTRVKIKNNGQVYTLLLPQEECRITTGGESVSAKVIQGEIQIQTFTGTGTPLQSFTATVKATTLIDNFYVRVFVNGEEWRKYESIYDMPRDGKGFLVKTGISGGIDLYFGNTNFGMAPPQGSEIRVEYLTTVGEIGNMREGDNVEFEWLDSGYSITGEEIDLNEVLQTRMTQVITFGSNPEPTFLTRLMAPKTSRSFVLANPENYIIFLQKFNYFSIVDAYTTFDDDFVEDDNVIYLFLVPDINKRLRSNENYFTVPQEYFLLTEQEEKKVLDLIEDSGSKIVTTVVKIVEPEIRKYLINISVIAFSGFSKETIRASIIENLSQYFLSNRRRDRIPKSDIVKIIESIEGVDSVNVQFVSELNEIAKKSDPNSPLIGLDEMGDIVMNRGEMVLIRGGWTDRAGVYYEDSITDQKPCTVNIQFKADTPYDFNGRLTNEITNNLSRR